MAKSCTICKDPKVKKVNSLIGKCVSFRHISSQVFGKPNRYNSICRHASNCLGFDVQKALKEKRLDEAIDAYKEFIEQLKYAKQLRDASQEQLRDETGKISLDPRRRDIDVIYDDPLDTDKTGKPKRKRQNLDIIMDKVEGTGRYSNTFAMVNGVDIYKFALDTLKAADMVIDKFAKIDGDYTKEQENPKSLTDTAIAKELDKRLEALNWNEADRREFIQGKFPDIQELGGVD